MASDSVFISPFHEIAPPPSIRGSHISALIYHFHNNTNYVWMVTTYDSGLWKYNLDQQIIEEKYEYSSDIYSLDGWGCLDAQNDILYFCFDYDTLVSFHLKSKQWTVLCEGLDMPNLTFIKSPIQQLHLTIADKHFRYDSSTESLQLLSNKTGAELHINSDITYNNRAKYIYNDTTQQLMMFQEECNHILVCDLKSPNQQSTNWRKYETELPFVLPGIFWFGVELVWDQILFIIDSDEIWCLDLLHNRKWFRVSIPEYLGYSARHAIKDRQNNIHLLTISTFNGREIKPRHFMASLYDLVPSEIIDLNRNEYDALVFGYVKDFENCKPFQNVTYYLKQLILKYYPLFL